MRLVSVMLVRKEVVMQAMKKRTFAHGYGRYSATALSRHIIASFRVLYAPICFSPRFLSERESRTQNFPIVLSQCMYFSPVFFES